MDVREHIRQDIQPYVCTYEKCPDTDRMYASRHAWIEHERLVHRRIWRCFEHRSFISTSKNGLLQHFLDCHKGLDGQQIENLLDLAETTVSDNRQTCPFCYSIGPFDKGFYNHVAFHQEQLATFAVPRSFDSNNEADSGRAKGTRLAGSLRSVALYFRDGDSSLDSDDSEVSVNKVDNPLLNAAEIGDEAVVRLLLKKGADVNAQGGEYGNALQAASHRDHEKVVQMLLDRGAGVLTESGALDNQFTLDTVSKLGLLYFDQGKQKEAEKMYQRALAGYEKTLGPNHTSTRDTVNKLGLVYADQAKLEEAERMYQRALEGYEEVLGREHPDTLTTVNHLGSVLSDQGKYEEAEAMHRRALEAREKLR